MNNSINNNNKLNNNNNNNNNNKINNSNIIFQQLNKHTETKIRITILVIYLENISCKLIKE